MNKVVRTVEKIQFFQLKKSFFHSSPILERRRRTNYDSRVSNYYNKRGRKINGQREFAETVSAFDEDIFFRRFLDDYDENRPSSNRTQSSRGAHPWFMPDFFSDNNRGRPRRRGPKPGRRFDFCGDDDSDVEIEFHATYDGDKDFFYTFTNKDFEGDYKSSNKTRSQRKFRHEFDYEYNSSEESNCSATDSASASYRLTLGLKASGPLRLEDVKNAYRACALQWHPDRHQGSAKAVAEEKFKICSAAYQSLCDRLAVN